MKIIFKKGTMSDTPDEFFFCLRRARMPEADGEKIVVHDVAEDSFEDTFKKMKEFTEKFFQNVTVFPPMGTTENRTMRFQITPQERYKMTNFADFIESCLEGEHEGGLYCPDNLLTIKNYLKKQ